jgi:hypothetical protein
MTMIKPKIKGLKQQKPKGVIMHEADVIGRKGYGTKKGQFLGDKAGVK